MLNKCSRCGGNTFLDDDGDRACLQCGARVYSTPAFSIEEERALLRTFSTGKDGGRNVRPPQVATPRNLAKIAAQLRLEV